MQEPIIRAVMACDAVREAELRQLLARVRDAWNALDAERPPYRPH